MQDSINPARLTRWPRACLLVVATLTTGVLVAGCGGSAGRSTASGSPTTGIPGLAFAECMRSNGVPNFPDPSPGGGFVVGGPGINPSSPAVSAAKEKCQQYLPILGGSGGSAFSAQVQEQALAKLLKIAQCMRQHGIADFPDPSASRPSNINIPPDTVEITDYDGVFIVFPATLNMQSPAYTRAAAAACGALASKVGRKH